QERFRIDVPADQLERAALAELVRGAFGEMYRAHAAAADLAQQLPAADLAAGIVDRRVRFALVLQLSPQRVALQRARLERGRRGVRQPQQFVDPGAQRRFVLRRDVEERRARLARQRQRLVEQRIDPCARIAGRGHASALSSHALARIQSRWTVRRELSSARAVSSSLMPAKKRHSTTCARRGLKLARSSSARSTPTIRSSCSSPPAISAVSVTGAWPPPRLAAQRMRAW